VNRLCYRDNLQVVIVHDLATWWTGKRQRIGMFITLAEPTGPMKPPTIEELGNADRFRVVQEGSQGKRGWGAERATVLKKCPGGNILLLRIVYDS
jgi:hypothetical protein